MKAHLSNIQKKGKMERRRRSEFKTKLAWIRTVILVVFN